MSWPDLFRMAVGNLWRSRLRTFLTAAGVIIGIGALVSMLSFGTGMQRYYARAFQRHEAFTLLRVRAAADPAPQERPRPEAAPPGFGEEALERVRRIPGVVLVYRDASVPVQLRREGRQVNLLLRAVPPEVRDFPPFDRLAAGGFFSSGSAREIILSDRMLARLELRDAEAAVGAEVQVVTARLNLRDILSIVRSRGIPGDTGLFASEAVPFRIVGVWREELFRSEVTGSAFVPEGTAEELGALPFSSVFEFLDRAAGPQGAGPGPATVFVRVGRPQDTDRVARLLREEGYEVFSFLEQFGEVRRAILAWNGILASVGLIALVVAALGIINTMVTAVLERTRQIGILMAIGASRADIRRIFLFEAGSIGLIGGAAGILLGVALSRAANLLGNQIVRESGVPIAESGLPPVDFFVTPWWLMLGALLFAVTLALLAAVYPAGRAARMDPVQSLRQD